ncbi:hypothetical protein ACFUIV_26885 [Streptomyces anulatus]|uniref:hypothetical protein n=1 Tax=Streptomyces anulatus TaxID=1892 RepID=UPI0036286D5C
MTSLPQPHRDDHRGQLDRPVLAAEAALAHLTQQKREARRTVRRVRHARRVHLVRLRAARTAELSRRAAAAASSPAALAGLGVVVFISAIVMFVQGNAQAADMLSAAVGFWALALAVRHRK